MLTRCCFLVLLFQWAVAVVVVTATDFVVTESAISSPSSPTGDQFVKHFAISADVAGELTAISALALNLPDQVFVTYASTASVAASNVHVSSTAAHGALLGEITVSASTEALATSVSVVSNRAMKGEKLAVTSAAADERVNVLTEVVLLTKNALKKVIANGAGDVVIADNMFFTKKRTDYDVPSQRRLTRAAGSANASSGWFSSSRTASTRRRGSSQLVARDVTRH